MTGAESLVDKLLLFGLGQEAGGGKDNAVTHDDRSVMERGVLEEDISEKLFTGNGVQDSTRVYLLAKLCLTLDNDERTCGGG